MDSDVQTEEEGPFKRELTARMEAAQALIRTFDDVTGATSRLKRSDEAMDALMQKIFEAAVQSDESAEVVKLAGAIKTAVAAQQSMEELRTSLGAKGRRALRRGGKIVGGKVDTEAVHKRITKMLEGQRALPEAEQP